MADSFFTVATERESGLAGAGPYHSASWGGGTGEPPKPPKPPKRFGFRVWGRIAFVVLGLLIQFGVGGYRTHQNNKQALKLRPVWHHDGVVLKPEQLHGTGQIYLVQMGTHKDPYTVVALATWLRQEYGLETQILAAASLDRASYDPARREYVAERICDQIKREHPAVAADPNAFVIGFTDEKMYTLTGGYTAPISWRDGKRMAIISSYKIHSEVQTYQPSAPDTKESLTWDRLRRILLKDVAVLFWHLPLNDDPGSVLYHALDLDAPDYHLYQTDLDPMHSLWGIYLLDPCVTFTHLPGAGAQLKLPLFGECKHPEGAGQTQMSLDTPETPPDTSEERIELRLAYGLLTEKHTDFFLPGQVPIRLERANDNQWQMPGAFGMSGGHNYDRFLASHDGMQHVLVVNAGSADVPLERRPYWLSMLQFNQWVDTEFSGSTLSLRWFGGVGEHFDLTRYDGEVDTYLPCEDSVLCYLNGYRDAQGKALTFERDAQRNLLSLSAPDSHWLRLTHDVEPRIRVTEILDSSGRRVRYEYNAKGQLASVTYPSGEVIAYGYDDRQNLLTVKVGQAGDAMTTLMTNVYDRGWLVSQTLADGSVYRYEYLGPAGQPFRRVDVTTPDGTVYQVGFVLKGAAIRVRPTGPEAGPAGPAKVAGMRTRSGVPGWG